MTLFTGLALLLVAIPAHAVDLGDCAETDAMKMEAMFASAAGDFSSKPAFVIRGTKLAANDDSVILSKDLSDTKDAYRLKVDFGNGIRGERTYQIEKDASGMIVTKRSDDPNAIVEAMKKAGQQVQGDPTIGAVIGVEQHYASHEGKCRLEQSMTLRKVKMGSKIDVSREVYQDAKLCDRMRDELEKAGRPLVETCMQTISGIGGLFQKRQSELSAEGKILVNPGAGIMNDYGSVAMKIAFCAPSAWKMAVPGLMPGVPTGAAPAAAATTNRTSK